MTSFVNPRASDDQELRGLAPSTRHSPSAWQVAGLVALVAVNLAATVAMHWYAGQRLTGSRSIFEAVHGAMFMQLAMLGTWLTLGDGKWYLRALAAIPLAMCLGFSRGFAILLSPMLRQRLSDSWQVDNFWAMFFSLELLLVLVIVLIPLRKLFGWRLTSFVGESTISSSQFSLTDMMIWMIPIGGYFVVRQLSMSMYAEHHTENLQNANLRMTVEFVFFAVSVIALLHATGLESFSWPTWAVVIGMIVLLGLGLAGDAYWSAALTRAKLSGVLLGRASRITLTSIAFSKLIYFFAGASVGLVNVWMLRLLGIRFRHARRRPRSAHAVEAPA
jgi:hypothetical protein